MIRGITFQVEQSLNTTVLFEIFQDIAVEKLFWTIDDTQNETWADRSGEEFFDDNEYSGKRFIQKIQLNHYIVFIKLQAYFNRQSSFEIHTFEDFENSSCQILLLICDCTDVDIYVKDDRLARTIYENAIKSKFRNVSYITDENDKREHLDVL